MNQHLLQAIASLAILSSLLSASHTQALISSSIENTVQIRSELKNEVYVGARNELDTSRELDEKITYTPPSTEIIAKTRAQVESFDCSTVTDVPQIECEALVALYSNTSWVQWWNKTNWLVTTTVDSWFGITVEDNHVTKIDLSNNNLYGILPPEIGDLPSLTHLRLSHNRVTGLIPPELGKLTSLIELDLFRNWCGGEIPSDLVNLNKLQVLSLGDNHFSGSIPAWLGDLSNLVSLGLEENELTGMIPPALGNLSNLEVLLLGRNALTGSIPSEIGNLAKLYRLDVEFNQLSGLIPPEIARLSNLKWLEMQSNLLFGSIPVSFVILEHLDHFNFSDTNICEPDHPSFILWKNSVSTWIGSGLVCEAFESPSWLLIYYLAGDNNLDESLQMTISFINYYRNPNIDIAIFYDSARLDTSYRFYPSSGGVRYIPMGNLNSADGQTLTDFITWAESKSTAQNRALIIGDHGHGLTGVATDMRGDFTFPEPSDKIVVSELRQALLPKEKFDVIYSHTCLTANLEFMWELRDLTDYYVASESISFLPTSHDYLMQVGPDTTASDLALSMAESYYISLARPSNPSTISVVDMRYLHDMFDRTNNLALAIKMAPIEIKTNLWGLLDHSIVQRFDEGILPGIDNFDRFADLFHFASLTNYFPELSFAAQALLSTENNFVLYNRAWSGTRPKGTYWNHDNARGVSIALPLNPISFYKGEWLDFASGADWSFVSPSTQSFPQMADYNWGPMVSDLISLNNPEGVDEPTPPEPVPMLVHYEIFIPMILR